ncbi:hypothetical protein FAZ69_08325 [Trinickia terrae]|uniref:Uncharacterized protein n=2 Tax=Trinickia terrae TaxID=2571161 RepID=A0A4U1IA16_9BURK|nr:hypothetical protein FAZ69_08325 [Trinickia terrae]
MQKTPGKPDIPTDQIDLFPFGDELVARMPQERVHEEVHQGIPALSAVADATVSLSNRLPNDARNALFFSAPGVDEGLREIAVEVALRRREEATVVQPDFDYLRGQQSATRQNYETGENDLWMPRPPRPGD